MPRQLPPKPIGLFAAHALALTLLLGFWSTPRAAYPDLFRAHANGLFAALGAPELRLEPRSPDARPRADTWLRRAAADGGAPPWEAWFDLDRIGWWPSAALVALLLATPLAPGRRALAIAGGLVLLDAVTLGRIGVEIGYAGYELAHGSGAPARGPLHLLLRVGSESLTATVPSAAAVLVLWVLLARPRHAIDLGRWLRAPPSARA